MCFIGNKAKGTPFLQALLSCDVEKVLLNEVAEKSFLNQQNSVAKVLRGEGELLPVSTRDQDKKLKALLPKSWTPVVYNVRPHFVADGRDDQRDVHQVPEYSTCL